MVSTISTQVLVHLVLGALLLPPLNMLLLMSLGLGLRRRWRRLGAGLLVLGMAGLYALSTPLTAMWLNRGLERYPVIDAEQLGRVEAIVVLSGGKKPAPEYGRMEPAADSLARLRYAARLARQSGKPMLLTGGAPMGGEAEAATMARVLREDYGIVPRWVETRSNTTLENARYSAELLRSAGIKRIALVSQGWHLRRALPFFERQGLEVTAAPTAFIRYDGGGVAWWLPSGRAMQECHAALREWLGMLFYRMKGE
ncbi:uncharacterized SAM-binding protein YcdF (DUF218 family) [Chromobacterium alkanivorans]|uniref:YdcF family protein n=1 Tax=Chromobacterium alkanivorans TaxID=1071719 RepID=UPI0021694EB4|nr:YdcF family protein [Chromobacterium alkanivorans]MCS3803663.1 uncharacterized SAM-binding protein YcdF (DUF218 family) [Chromobacterium alkanivorans]MCS3818232.1 uncharacterized SAM-binding protein YcdF (DUF218 family) [Chromobacterium alkanivorans]MCS3874569.1 uncharacterized SAM-binding protein YcdF (DUF218 family) [Chromobacterium alkanivorans]